MLLCSQVEEGGFRDKPGTHRDYYHTCYCLSGLSVSQYSWSKCADSSLLEPIHPLFNVVLDRYYEARSGPKESRAHDLFFEVLIFYQRAVPLGVASSLFFSKDSPSL